MGSKHANWTEDHEGYHHEQQGTAQGLSPFDKPLPPVRDSNGYPLIRDGNVRIDWNQVLKEKEEKPR